MKTLIGLLAVVALFAGCGSVDSTPRTDAVTGQSCSVPVCMGSNDPRAVSVKFCAGQRCGLPCALCSTAAFSADQNPAATTCTADLKGNPSAIVCVPDCLQCQ